VSTSYNLIAGRSVDRLAALSDGIFGVAMTLLLLELHTPAKPPMPMHSEAYLFHELVAMVPPLLVYLMSFITLGIFWVGQQAQLNYLDQSNRDLTWLHLGFLFAVTLLPFTTQLLSEFITYRVALLAYWANILLLGMALYATWGRAIRAKLVKADMPVDIAASICRRILFGQLLYAFGAALCVFNTYVSIGFIISVQLYYVISPRVRHGV
jgi:uncharacterized membrane protein